MSIKNFAGKKTILEVKDRLSFNFNSSTISLFKGDSGAVYFSFTSDNFEGEKRTRKKLATFIKSQEDFVSFAIFLGRLFLLEGELVERNKNAFIWSFTRKGVGPKSCYGPGTKLRFNQDNSFITIQEKDVILRLVYPAPFISDEYDFDTLLMILSEIYDCKFRIDREVHKDDTGNECKRFFFA